MQYMKGKESNTSLVFFTNADFILQAEHASVLIILK